MLTKLKEAFESSKTRDAKRLDALLDQLDDPVARQTEWTPAVRGGTNFRTHRLAEISPLRLELKPTFGAMLFCWVFIVMGLVPVGLAVGVLPGRFASQFLLWLVLPIGLIFVVAGVWMYRSFSRPRVFDMQDLWFWRGKRPDSRDSVEDCKKSAPLDQVHAIQIVAELCRGSRNSGSYYSYEINLVLHDGSRVNVVDHGNLKHIRKDARKIADLIGVSVWDAAE
jgi:hypothetical protein